jgi:Flp pilus assembly protein TadD
MVRKPACWLLLCCTAGLLLAAQAGAQQVRIPLPKRSKATPVQKLNREGVKAVRHHDYEKAKKLFYDAYLIDPNDPFTLNNLGYISELEGQVDRAERFYALAAENKSDAAVDLSNVDAVKGKPVSKIAGEADDRQMQVNRFNVQAIDLLLKDRAPEADLVLQKALALNPNDPFTLNNLGFAREKEGEYDQAMGFYTRAAQQHSRQPIIVTLKRDWRGKPISEIADHNARALRKLMAKEETVPLRVARLNLRGVSALNRNDPQTARKDFQDAYKLDTNNAFTLNNLGYMAEMDGDRETADFYYAKAQEAERANRKVDVATRAEVQGKLLKSVANGSDQAVQQRIETALMAKRREGGPVRLLRRDNTPVIEPDKPVAPLPPPNQPQGAQQPLPQNQLLMPLPANQQPPDAYHGATPNVAPSTAPQSQPPQSAQPQGGLMMPLPDNQQPPNADKGAQPVQNNGATPKQNAPQSAPPSQNSQPPGGIMMPLPDNQQPPNADKGAAPPVQNNSAPQQNPQQKSPPPNSQPQGGVMMPLPDNQQPPNADKGPTPPVQNNPQQQPQNPPQK